MSFISEFLSALGGATVILYGLTKFVSAIWASRMNNKDKASHSIAQEAYAKFFSSKMEAYIKLANFKRDFLLAKKEYIHDPDDGAPINNASITMMLAIRRAIHENYIYLSKELIDSFETWNEEFIKVDKDTTIDIKERWSYFSQLEDVTGESANSLASEETRYSYQFFLDENIELWNCILRTIDKDVINLRKRYDL